MSPWERYVSRAKTRESHMDLGEVSGEDEVSGEMARGQAFITEGHKHSNATDPFDPFVLRGLKQLTLEQASL